MEQDSQNLSWSVWDSHGPKDYLQELQYSQFRSAQGLLNAMRDYQRMAPEMLNMAQWSQSYGTKFC